MISEADGPVALRQSVGSWLRPLSGRRHGRRCVAVAGRADAGEVLIADGFGEHCPVTCGPDAALDWVEGKQGVCALCAQAGATGPREGCGIIHNAGAYRAEVDIAVNGVRFTYPGP